MRQKMFHILNPYDGHGTFQIVTKDRMAKQLSQIKSSTRTRIKKISRIRTIHSIKMTATTNTISPPHDIEYYDGNDFTNNFQCCHRCSMSVHIVSYDAYQSSIFQVSRERNEKVHIKIFVHAIFAT